MKKNAIIKSLRIIFIAAFVAATAVLLSYECGIIEKGTLAKVVSPSVAYMIQVVNVMLTIILVPFAIKGFTRSLGAAKGLSEDAILKLFAKRSLQRIFLLFIVIVMNEVAYYGLGYDGALYCGILAIGALVYSFPTRMVLEQFLCDKEK